MSKYICGHCGAPTDNDQSFTIEEPLCSPTPLHFEVHRCDDCDRRVKQEVKWQNNNEHYADNTIICPYCDYEYDDYDAYEYDDGNHEEVECPMCGKKFDLEVETRREYSTKRSLCEMPTNYGEEEEEE